MEKSQKKYDNLETVPWLPLLEDTIGGENSKTSGGLHIKTFEIIKVSERQKSDV